MGSYYLKKIALKVEVSEILRLSLCIIFIPGHVYYSKGKEMLMLKIYSILNR